MAGGMLFVLEKNSGGGGDENDGFVNFFRITN